MARGVGEEGASVEVGEGAVLTVEEGEEVLTAEEGEEVLTVEEGEAVVAVVVAIAAAVGVEPEVECGPARLPPLKVKRLHSNVALPLASSLLQHSIFQSWVADKELRSGNDYD